MEWPSVSDLEAWIGDTVPLVRGQLLLDLAISACHNLARSIGAQIDQVNDDEVTLDGNGADTIMLPGWPVTAVTSVTIDGHELAADEYDWSKVGELTRSTVFADGGWPGASPRTFGAWPLGKRNVTVVYTHGLVAIPDDLKLAVLSAAARWAANPQSLTRFSGDNVGMGFGGGILTPGEAELVLRGIR